MARLVFMGTPAFAVPVLEALLATQTVVGVVTQPDRPAGRGQELRPSPVKEVALRAGVSLYQPASLRPPDAAAPLQVWEPQAIVVAAYGQILRPHVLSLPSLGCINVHASLLPRWRGAAPIHHAILAGDRETGVSLMQMDEGLDTGPVFVQAALPIHPAETAETLHDRLALLGAEMVRRHLDDILAGRLAPWPQEEAAATYAPMIKKEEGELDWQEPAAVLERRVRAMTPWPGAYTWWEGKRLRIITARVATARVAAGDAHRPPGSVMAEGEAIVVHSALGRLQLLEVQPAGKRVMDVAAFVNGRPDFVGSRLGRDATS